MRTTRAEGPSAETAAKPAASSNPTRAATENPAVTPSSRMPGVASACRPRNPALASSAIESRKVRSSSRRAAASLAIRPSATFTPATVSTSQKCEGWCSQRRSRSGSAANGSASTVIHSPSRRLMVGLSRIVPSSRIPGQGAHEARRAAEVSRLNRLPSFLTELDGLDIHFLHVRSQHADALPVIVTHGWPGSIIEQLKLIGPLTDPTSHGGSETDAFDVVIPSLPGHGFSAKPTATGWDPARIARAWDGACRCRLHATGNSAEAVVAETPLSCRWTFGGPVQELKVSSLTRDTTPRSGAPERGRWHRSQAPARDAATSPGRRHRPR